MKNRLDEAFKVVERHNFMPANVKELAPIDSPQPIGYGQTISQPSLVRQMLEWLEVSPGQKVLDVGSGSGWTSALLSQLVGKNGQVVATELIAELVEFGEANCQRLGLKNISFHQAGDTIGWPEAAPFDRILVSASADKLPDDLVKQLAPGGRLVIPVANDILVIGKQNDGDLEIDRHHGFMFVPLIT